MFDVKISDILKRAGEDFCPSKVSLAGNRVALVEGQKGNLSFSDVSVKFKMPDGTLEVSGEKLVIEEISKTAAIVSGKISGVFYDR